VIAFDQPFTHKGSQQNLLGKDPPKELIESLSNEKQVTSETPPTFLFHTAEDTGVPPENSMVFYAAMLEHKVPGELHIYQKGPHGVGLAANIPGTSDWPNTFQRWLKVRGLLDAAK
jgi:dipeptidyl aminopeptidase/acylaminoacyl peptidase